MDYQYYCVLDYVILMIGFGDMRIIVLRGSFYDINRNFYDMNRNFYDMNRNFYDIVCERKVG